MSDLPGTDPRALVNILADDDRCACGTMTARRRGAVPECANCGERAERPKRKPPRRISRPRNLTLTPAASAALDALSARPGGDNASAEASVAILARAAALGVLP